MIYTGPTYAYSLAYSRSTTETLSVPPHWTVVTLKYIKHTTFLYMIYTGPTYTYSLAYSRSTTETLTLALDYCRIEVYKAYNSVRDSSGCNVCVLYLWTVYCKLHCKLQTHSSLAFEARLISSHAIADRSHMPRKIPPCVAYNLVGVSNSYGPNGCYH